MNELRTGPWSLTDLDKVKKNGKTVFSCFHCGGGSTMGYKLAGFDVLGGVEIDHEMMAIYKANHKTKHSYLMGVQEFKSIPDKDLPKELFELDILDGSPPCSSFSMAGSREKKWGEAHKFREGQAVQNLDDLFFEFIAIAKKLQPKVVVAENVKGLIQGSARGYVKQIFAAFRDAGYETQLFLFNAACMGVPQARERTFFIARKIFLKLPNIKMAFQEPEISISKAFNDLPLDETEMANGSVKTKWALCMPGRFAKAPSGNTFGFIYRSHPNRPSSTVTGSPRVYHWAYPRIFNVAEVKRAQSFPDDYNFNNQIVSRAHYICGMSVPPFMMQRIATQIYEQLLK